MEFQYKGKTYRLYRGTGTRQWLILGLLEGRTSDWRLLTSFSSLIDEADAINHAKNVLDELELSTEVE